MEKLRSEIADASNEFFDATSGRIEDVMRNGSVATLTRELSKARADIKNIRAILAAGPEARAKFVVELSRAVQKIEAEKSRNTPLKT